MPRCFLPPGLLLILCAVSIGCAAPLPLGTLEQREELAAMRYPADAPTGDTLQIDAKRQRHHVRFINREPRTIRNATLWINQQYVGRIDRIGIGPDNNIALNRFVNMHGETFPTGGFLSPDDAAALISIELVTADADGNPVRRPMTVWPDKRWFED